MKLKTLALLILALPAWAYAKPKSAVKTTARKAPASPTKDVTQALAGYRAAKAVQAKVKKTVVQETLGTSMSSAGKFFFSKGKMRLEMSEPERTTLVYDGKTIWFESRADEDHIVVNKIGAAGFRRSDSLLAALFDKNDALKQFNLKSSKTDENKKTFAFEPKDKKKSDVKSLEIVTKDKDIQRISYKDQVDNVVTLEFSDVTKGPVSADKFSYKPPKGAEISELK